MDKQELIELTNKLYRQTLLFPKKEPLRYKMRETASQILESIIVWHSFQSPNPGTFAANKGMREKDVIFSVEKNLDILNGYFEVAKWQNWISYFDILEVQEKYDKIRCNFKKEIGKIEEKENKVALPEIPAEEPKKEVIKKEVNKLAPRGEKILNIIKELGKAQVGEVNKHFPDVSKRTLRRDFQKLVSQGLIEREGDRNDTYYKYKNYEV